MFLCRIPTSCPPVPPRETRTIFNHQPQQFMQLKSFFKGVSVTLIHRLGLKKTCGLVPNAGNFEFENTTVKDYFKKARGRRIEYPNIIGIQVGSKDRDEVIPAEMCIIAPDQRYTRKLPPEFSLLNNELIPQCPA
ncbi:PAZ domain-containing protein [Suillus placidus]|uniref:PAZ domain-containing protein n=1 Tax=Suillus placidus TaxID=48579 RepID=A0A9P6ZST4_9AGAM|nr:PAZ domain-containing protein [Suillus placidus]KAG1776114.1 PAZ domain-containing protein [Suillus placidus]